MGGGFGFTSGRVCVMSGKREDGCFPSGYFVILPVAMYIQTSDFLLRNLVMVFLNLLPLILPDEI